MGGGALPHILADLSHEEEDVLQGGPVGGS